MIQDPQDGKDEDPDEIDPGDPGTTPIGEGGGENVIRSEPPPERRGD